MASLKIRSGVSSATFSISTPPSGLTIITGALGRAIDHQPEVQLAGDVEPLLDQQPRDLLPGRAGLVGDERHPEHLRGGLRRCLRPLDHLDAAALAAAAGVNLRLDDDRAAAEPLGRRLRRRRVDDHLARGDRHAVLREDCLRLILVNLHASPTALPAPRTECGCRRGPPSTAQPDHHVPGGAANQDRCRGISQRTVDMPAADDRHHADAWHSCA